MLQSLISDPTSYPAWVASLQSFEPSDHNTYLGAFGYLTYRKQVRMRRLTNAPGHVAWKRVGGSTRIRIELATVEDSDRRTHVVFRWTQSGSGSIFGVSATSPILKAALETIVAASLERLAALSTAESTRISG